MSRASPLTAEERRLRAATGGFTKAVRHDPLEATAAAREALWRRYLATVDPDNLLDAAEQARRARAQMGADLARARLRAARARRDQADAAVLEELLVGGAP